MTCDFTYIETKGEVTGFKFDETSKKMVITGTTLPKLAVQPTDQCSPIAVEADCKLDTSCTWANNACSKVVVETCGSLKSNALCSALSVCFWKTNSCSLDTCQNKGTSSDCSADNTCIWENEKCSKNQCKL